METLKSIFDFYIKSSIHVALAVVALAVVTMLELQIDLRTSLLFFIFFGTITAYNFIKYATVAKFRHRSLSLNLRVIQAFSFLCFVALAYFSLKQALPVLIASAVLGLVSLLYVIPPSPNRNNLRSISGIKIFVIAFSWAGVTVVLPALTTDGINIYGLLISFIQRCLFIIVLTLPFDIRDLGIDESRLDTIPQIYGAESAKTISMVLLSLVVLLDFLKQRVDIYAMVVLVSVVSMTYYLVQKSVQQQSAYFSSFWVEGIPIVWCVLLLLESYI